MQNVIASRDFDLYLNFDAIGVPFRLGTGASFTYTVSGTTDDIGAFGTSEPIAVDNGENTYDINISLQKAEFSRIMNAVAAATVGSANGSVTHIRQIIEAMTVTAVYHKRNDVPKTSTVETFTRCSGVEQSDSVERRGTEILTQLRIRARGMMRGESPL